MHCGDGSCYDETFDAEHAARRLREYRRSGPDRSSRRLIDALAAGGVEGSTVLDVGGGVGAIHHELLARGAASAIDVDASGPYLAAARQEAERRGHLDRARYVRGDLVALAADLEPADIVALDRVVCCYGDMPALVASAAALTRRHLGLVLPRDDPWIRAGSAPFGWWSRLRRDPFRFYVHRLARVDAVVRQAGLLPAYEHRGWFWRTVVFERSIGQAGGG